MICITNFNLVIIPCLYDMTFQIPFLWNVTWILDLLSLENAELFSIYIRFIIIMFSPLH
jgi:hypothetical protein